MFDAFFDSLGEQPHDQWQLGVSNRGFAKAHSRFAPRWLQDLNTWLLKQAEAMEQVPRWHGLRVVAGNAPR